MTNDERTIASTALLRARGSPTPLSRVRVARAPWPNDPDLIVSKTDISTTDAHQRKRKPHRIRLTHRHRPGERHTTEDESGKRKKPDESGLVGGKRFKTGQAPTGDQRLQRRQSFRKGGGISCVRASLVGLIRSRLRQGASIRFFAGPVSLVTASAKGTSSRDDIRARVEDRGVILQSRAAKYLCCDTDFDRRRGERRRCRTALL